jgi:hypothetical protein
MGPEPIALPLGYDPILTFLSYLKKIKKSIVTWKYTSPEFVLNNIIFREGGVFMVKEKSKKKNDKEHECNCDCELCCGSKDMDIEENENRAEGGETEGGRRMVNPIQVEKFLKGMDYPVSKQDIIQKAEEEGADDNVIETLNKLPERQYNSPVSISKELGKIE